MKKVASLLALIVITNLPISCGPSGCSGVNANFSIILNIAAEIGNLNEQGFNNNPFVDYQEGGLVFYIDQLEYFDKISYNNFSLISSAVADDCVLPSPEPFQLLDSIKITSDTPLFINGIEFNEDTELNNIFSVQQYGNSELSIEEMIQELHSGDRYFGYSGDVLFFKLVDKPDVAVNQKFTFTFTFDDGAVYVVQTPIFAVE